MRAWRGPGAAAHGPRRLPRGVGPNRWRARGAGMGRGSETGRRPLLGQPARLSRAFSQKVGAPSRHAPGHPRGGRRSGTKKPGGPRRGGNRGPPGLTIFYYPTGRGQNTKGASPPAKPRPMGVCFGEPPKGELRRISLPRTRVNKLPGEPTRLPTLRCLAPSAPWARIPRSRRQGRRR
jgi:hypothetical protein